ncbi:MAG: arsenite S-adenosylmethyltransferase [Acidobacteria bacterium]|nr:MAG: arsenite S-adenosylmethyltransferase [Acidobacteriota bacterium]
MSNSNCGCGAGATAVAAPRVDEADQTKSRLRDTYAASANGERGFAGDRELADSHSEQLGYERSDLEDLPEGANLGLGCGNPTALASIRPGEVILDLGSGAGIDCLIAAKKAGPGGQVIGVDMTPEMVEKARANAAEAGVENVEFRLGEIEHLPVADSSVDLVISNCVINLAADKGQVFKEIHRVLKPGGRVAISDTATRSPLPPEMLDFVSTFIGCGDNTLLVDEYRSVLQSAGLRDVSVVDAGSSWVSGSDTTSCCASSGGNEGIGIDDVRHYLTSVSVTAVK